MNKLTKYLNSLSVDEQHDFATRCMTTVGYLRKACSKGQQIGPMLCTSIEIQSGGAVTRKDLNADSWQKIWPELTEEVELEARIAKAQGGMH